MEFYIKKDATLPVLKMSVVKDGRSSYDNFMSQIETSSLFFSMVNVDTGIPKITTRPAGFVEKVKDNPDAPDEFYIYYRFTGKDTNKVGRYEGQFLLKNDDGNLILPIREQLFINVQESFINQTPSTDSMSGAYGANVKTEQIILRGIDGLDGINGLDGTSGTSGIDGTSGTSGIDGTSGTSGIDGTSGTSGVDGENALLDEIDGHIIPTLDETWDIGSEDRRFRDIYLSNNTIKMKSGTISIDEDGSFSFRDNSGDDLPIIASEVRVRDEPTGDVTILKMEKGSLVLNTTNVSGETKPTEVLAGTSGTSGTSGVNGSSGISGIDGTSGTSGTSGLNGTSGTSGVDGSSGTSGTSGSIDLENFNTLFEQALESYSIITSESLDSKMKNISDVEYFDKESPLGVVDGVNKNFTLLRTPQLNSEHIYVNGLLMDSNDDYVIIGNRITFDEAPEKGYKIRCSYTYNGPLQISKETPNGVIDGVNKTFVLGNSPTPNSEHIYVNGLLMGEDDYSINDKVILFNEAPKNNYNIISSYRVL